MKYSLFFISFCAATFSPNSLDEVVIPSHDVSKVDEGHDDYTLSLLSKNWLHKRTPTPASKSKISEQEKAPSSTTKHDRTGRNQEREPDLSAQQLKVTAGKSKSKLPGLLKALSLDRFKKKGTENGSEQLPNRFSSTKQTSEVQSHLKDKRHDVAGRAPATTDLQDTENRRTEASTLSEASTPNLSRNMPALGRQGKYSHNRAKSFPGNGDIPSESRSKTTEAEVMAALWGPGHIRTFKSGPDRDVIAVLPGQFKEVTVRDPRYASAQAEMIEDPKFPSYTRKAMVTARGHKVMNRMERGFKTEIGHYDSTESRAPSEDWVFSGEFYPEDTKTHTWRYQSKPGSSAIKATTISRSGMATLEAEASVRGTKLAADLASNRNRYSNGRRSFQG